MIKVEVKESVFYKDTEKYSLFVTFPYDNEILAVMRMLPRRHWTPETKEWEVPTNKLSFIQDNLPDCKFTIINEELLEEKEELVPVVDYQFKTEPFKHQIEGFNYGLKHDRWLLGDEQGLGKTKQVIDIAMAKKIQKGYKHCLIICGVNGLKWNWQNEITTHSNETGYILGQKAKNGKLIIGSTTDKINDLDKLIDSPDSISSYFLITNVESLRYDEIATRISKLVSAKTIGLVAIDEIHKCKNPSSQQGKGILKIKSECRIAMTGTPLMNTPMDLFIVLKWLGYEEHSFYSFKNHYCVMGGYGGYEVIGYRYLDQLQTQLDEIMLRRRKDDVLDLPDKLYIDEYVDMTPKQAVIYKEISMEIKANIDRIATSNNPLAELIRMRQATGYTGILSSVVQESAKLDRMEEIVQESIENNKKVVIFSNWTQMTDVIVARLKKSCKCGILVITGETQDSVRQEYVSLFQKDKDFNVIVGTIGAMGTGLTLTEGTVEIFLDEPWNKALKDQAEDRCHRIGQNNNVTIYTLMCKNTMDERIHEIIRKKGAMSDALVDGNVVGNKLEMLEFLLS